MTNIIMLGTGTPNPVPERSGPCVAIVVNDKSYLVDFGPGVVRRAQKASRLGFKSLEAQNLKTAFLTHLHSDHTVGYSDLILTPWVLERDEPLRVYGPNGLKSMTEHILKAYSADIEARTYGLEQANKVGIEVIATEISEGLIYRDENVEVHAFRVIHPPFEAYGYKFITPDKTIVISGDTAKCDNLIKNAKGCDILIREVISDRGVKLRTPKWHKYHTSVHTTSVELGDIAYQVNPKSLVLYHQLFMAGHNENQGQVTIKQREDEIIEDIKRQFKGEIYSSNDLDVF